MVKFISLGSGSSGNCYFLGVGDYGILIDAGISARAIRKRLKDVDIDLSQVMAVFVTHDHGDHIKSLGVLAEKGNIPIYATRQVHAGIDKSHYVSPHLPADCVKYLEKQTPLQFRDFLIESFEVPHDGTDNVGYRIEAEGKVFCFLTDLGEITPLVASYAVDANYLIIESNYEEEMLRMGRYPQYLKDRISSTHGHLSNQVTARFLAENFSPRLKYIWLCHLSADNNHPELAYKATELALQEKGVLVGKDVELCALRRNFPSRLYEFE